MSDGRRVRLECCLCGGRYATSPQAVDRFLALLNPEAAARPVIEAPAGEKRTRCAARERQVVQAMDELKARGI